LVKSPTSDEVMSKARQITGLQDFGSGAFQEGLERTLAAFADMPLTPSGRELSIADLVRLLSNRLRIEDWYRTHPEIADLPIEGPVVVTGLPRTGTSAVVELLALDPRLRFTRKWEGGDPVPPPVAGQEANDPRAVAERQAAPNYNMSALHISEPDGPGEDLAMFAGLNMRAYHGRLPMPDDYIDWWMQDDFKSTYEYHERVLKLLQSRRPPYKWLLKSPLHLFNLEAVAAQYPQAKFVITHRHPCKVIPSVASLHWTLYGDRIDMSKEDKARTGRRYLAFWAQGVRRGMAARERIGNDRFIDVYNDDVVRDPIGTFEKVYDRLGMTFEPATAAAMLKFQENHPPGKAGGHRYSLEEYGLTAEAVEEQFADYIEKWQL
jgi:hypothetical protein